MFRSIRNAAKYPDRKLILWVAIAIAFSKWYADLREKIHVGHTKKALHPLLQEWLVTSRLLAEGYRPPALFSLGTQYMAGSIHTILHFLIRQAITNSPVKFKREFLTLDDGGTVGLDWAVSSRGTEAPTGSDVPIVFLQHGIGGNSDAQYIQNISDRLIHSAVAYRPVCMVARGCGKVPLTCNKGFSAAGFEDVAQAVAHIHKNNPSAKIYAVGYSMGAIIMANYIGRSGSECLFSGAVVFSASWDFSQKTPYFPIWSSKFLAPSMKQYLSENHETFNEHPLMDFNKAMGAECIHDFDAHATVLTHGYDDVDHYYHVASPINNGVEQISIPTLSICARDDPVCSIEGANTIEKNDLYGPGLVILKTNRGGHLGWGEGVLGNTSWMDRVVEDFFEHLERNN